MTPLQGLLIDIDGVIYIEDSPMPGASGAIEFIRNQNLPFRFLTNTTIRSRKSLADKLSRLNIPTRPEEVVSTCAVAAHWLRNNGMKRLHLLLPEDPRSDFAEFEITAENPEAVVVGDLGEGFTYDALNQAFRMLREGARLIALQKNPFWQTADGLAIDAGAYVAALEYAAGVQAVLVGKPNPAYFQAALQAVGLPPGNVAMIGDDIVTDIQGGHDAGLKTILVRTGKFKFDAVESIEAKPDWTIDSIADLPELLATL